MSWHLIGLLGFPCLLQIFRCLIPGALYGTYQAEGMIADCYSEVKWSGPADSPSACSFMARNPSFAASSQERLA
jgi:hypothetical protein